MSLLEVMLRGSAWLALGVSLLGLFIVGYGADFGASSDYSRRDRRVATIIGLGFCGAIWVGLAYALGGGTVNP